jgi:hypothetical protein
MLKNGTAPLAGDRRRLRFFSLDSRRLWAYGISTGQVKEMRNLGSR